MASATAMPAPFVPYAAACDESACSVANLRFANAFATLTIVSILNDDLDFVARKVT